MGAEEQIAEMLAAGGEEAPEEELEVTEEVEEEASGEEVPEGEEVEAEAEAGEEVLEEPVEEDTARAELEELKAKYAELEALVKAQQPRAEEPGEPAEPEDVDFLEGKSVEDWASDDKSFNKLLNKVFRAGAESVLRSVPAIVRTNVVQQQELATKTKEFYDTHKELAPFKGAVAAVAKDLLGQHPEWGLDKLYEETAKEAKKRLSLHTLATKSTKRPVFARTPGASPRAPKSKPALGPVEADIEAMNKALGA